MNDRNKDIYEKAESVVKQTVKDNSHIEIPLYERRKGKEFHASGSWQTTKGEKRLIEGFGWMFFIGVFFGLLIGFIHPGKLAVFFLSIGILGTVGTFISLFAIVFHKHKKEPMEAHYYDTDYTYNALTKEEIDHGKEITKEEFFKKE